MTGAGLPAVKHGAIDFGAPPSASDRLYRLTNRPPDATVSFMPAAPLIELEGVSKSYPSADGGEAVSILKDASLGVLRGESVAILGPSGSGKSTILNLLGGLDRPDRGVVRFDGRDLGGLPEPELARFRNRSVGFVFQQHHLLPHATVLENVLIPALASGNSVPDEAVARARRLIERVGLQTRMDQLPGRLSGGERQRVALVRALVNQPAVVLADEPTGALDRGNASEVARLLVELNQETGATLVIVTHSIELAGLCRRRLELRDGRLFAAA